MIVYHGTTEKFAEDIVKTGLVKREDLAFHLFHERTGRTEEETNPERRPRVTLLPDQAIAFAVFRTNYEKAQPGKPVLWGTPPFTSSKIKEGQRVDESAKPAIVVLDLPEKWRVQHDMEGTTYDFISLQDIPAEYVKNVVKGERLEAKIKEWGNPAALVTEL